MYKLNDTVRALTDIGENIKTGELLIIVNMIESRHFEVKRLTDSLDCSVSCDVSQLIPATVKPLSQTIKDLESFASYIEEGCRDSMFPIHRTTCWEHITILRDVSTIIDILRTESYNTNTILDKELVDLTKEEKTKVEEFHLSRIAFAILDGNIVINIKDKREHRVYLREDYGVSDEKFESLTRGYIKPNKMMFYTSSSFRPVEDIFDTGGVTPEILAELLEIAKSNLGEGPYILGNGIKVGTLGKEWEAIEIVTPTFNLKV